MIETKTIEDAYVVYKELAKQSIVSLVSYRKINNGFAKFLMKKVFDGYDVELSSANSLGFLSVRGRRPKVTVEEDGNVKGLVVDWFATKQLWAANPNMKLEKRLIYHTNEHSDGIRYKVRWVITNTRLLNKTLYSLVPCRTNKRNLSKMIKSGKEYFVTTN